jgi:hypothetical protein
VRVGDPPKVLSVRHISAIEMFSQITVLELRFWDYVAMGQLQPPAEVKTTVTPTTPVFPTQRTGTGLFPGLGTTSQQVQTVDRPWYSIPRQFWPTPDFGIHATLDIFTTHPEIFEVTASNRSAMSIKDAFPRRPVDPGEAVADGAPAGVEDWLELTLIPDGERQDVPRAFVLSDFTLTCHEEDTDQVRPFKVKVDGFKTTTPVPVVAAREVRSRTLIDTVAKSDAMSKFRIVFTDRRAVIDIMEFFGTLHVGGKSSLTCELPAGRKAGGQSRLFGSLPEPTGALGAMPQDTEARGQAGVHQRGRMYFEDFDLPALASPVPLGGWGIQ